jgi:hypothetical protein
VSALIAGGYTTTLYVMVDKVKGVGVHLPPSPAWVNFPSCWNVRQKVSVATLCTLWSKPAITVKSRLLGHSSTAKNLGRTPWWARRPSWAHSPKIELYEGSILGLTKQDRGADDLSTFFIVYGCSMKDMRHRVL